MEAASFLKGFIKTGQHNRSRSELTVPQLFIKTILLYLIRAFSARNYDCGICKSFFMLILAVCLRRA